MKRSKASNRPNQDLQNAAPGQASPLGISEGVDALQRRPAALPAITATTVTRTPDGVVSVQVPKSLDAMLKDVRTPTGTRNDEVAFRIIQQVANSLQRNGAKDTDGLLIEAISRIAEMAPQNATEALLATQMIATHDAGMDFLRRAGADDQSLELFNSYMLWGTRLMRLYIDQAEAMQKLKGKAGQQKVVVEHVHVYQGGQAIVGAVNSAKTEPGEGGNCES